MKTSKLEITPRQRFAIKLAKLLKEGWHERAGECCHASNETVGGTHYVQQSAQLEWYCKVTWLNAELINVKVCYRLNAHNKTNGMSGFNHTDRILSVGKDIHSTTKPAVVDAMTINNHVRQMQQYAREGIEAGLRAASQ